MVFKEMLELEKSAMLLQKQLRDKPRGYVTELKIDGYTFSPAKNPTIEIILLDPKKCFVAYRPRPHSEADEKNSQWFFGDCQKAVSDAQSWSNEACGLPEDHQGTSSQDQPSNPPELTLLGFF